MTRDTVSPPRHYVDPHCDFRINVTAAELEQLDTLRLAILMVNPQLAYKYERAITSCSNRFLRKVDGVKRLLPPLDREYVKDVAKRTALKSA